MASKNSATLALFFALNILFFTLTAATDCRCSLSPKPRPVLAPSFPRPSPRPLVPRPNPRPLVPSTNPRPLVTSPNPRPLVPSPSMPSPNPSPSVPSPLIPSPSVPSPSVPSPSIPNPSVPSPTTPGSSGNCPIDALRLGVCANVLSGLLNVQLGQPSAQPCCSVIQGLVDLEAAVCLCTALN